MESPKITPISDVSGAQAVDSAETVTDEPVISRAPDEDESASDGRPTLTFSKGGVRYTKDRKIATVGSDGVQLSRFMGVASPKPSPG